MSVLHSIHKGSLIAGSIAYDGVTTSQNSVHRVLGGSATYASIAASYFTPTSVCSIVGKDFLDVDKNIFISKKIDLNCLSKNAYEPTLYWRCEYDNNFCNRKTLDIMPHIFSEFVPNIPFPYDHIGYIFLGNMDPDIQWNVIKKIKSPLFIILDTIDFWIHNKKNSLISLLKKINLIILDIREAILLTGISDFQKSAEFLLNIGPDFVIIKDSKNGSYLFSKNTLSGKNQWHVPAYPVHALIDPTGAGDTYAGALIGYLCVKNQLGVKYVHNAMFYASAAASIAVESFSIHSLYSSSLKKIEERAKVIGANISI